jgi:hypothetical protein
MMTMQCGPGRSGTAALGARPPTQRPGGKEW